MESGWTQDISFTIGGDAGGSLTGAGSSVSAGLATGSGLGGMGEKGYLRTATNQVASASSTIRAAMYWVAQAMFCWIMVRRL